LPVRDNYNLKSHKYVCITTTNQTQNQILILTANLTTKQHAIVNIQLNIVTCRIRIQINSYETCCCTVSATLGCNCHTALYAHCCDGPTEGRSDVHKELSRLAKSEAAQMDSWPEFSSICWNQ